MVLSTPLDWLGIAEPATVAGAYAVLAVLGVLVFALAREWFGWKAGVVAALLVLTREPVLSFGLRAYVDLPYLCLLLGAVLVEARRPRAGVPVLVLLGLAGLIRPEAWLFAGAYALWTGERRLLVLAAVPPVLWALSDLVVTGNPLWSLTGTRDNAQELGRVTGLDDVPLTAPRRIGEILREPVLLGAVIGAWLAWKERLRLPLAAIALALAAFCVLAAAGLPILTRYLLAPAVLMAILCAGALFPRRAGWPWLAGALVTVVALVALAPQQGRRLQRLDEALDRQGEILAELKTLTEDACEPIALPTRRAVPQVALWRDIAPDRVVVAQDDGYPGRGTRLAPASATVADDFVLDRRDRNRALPPVPAGGDREQRQFWVVDRRC